MFCNCLDLHICTDVLASAVFFRHHPLKDIILNTVDWPNLVTYLNRPPKFKWHLVWCSPKSRCPKGIMGLKEILLRAQNMITILSSIANIIGGRGGYMTIQ